MEPFKMHDANYILKINHVTNFSGNKCDILEYSKHHIYELHLVDFNQFSLLPLSHGHHNYDWQLCKMRSELGLSIVHMV